MAGEQLIGSKQVRDMLDISRTTLWRKIKAGEVPQPIHYGSRLRWKKSEIEQFVNDLLEGAA